MTTPEFFPLRWESTGDHWWYASPIDCAAADGLFHVVVHLLSIDPNLLVKLTSLRRVRRLESVWDDDNSGRFLRAAQHRSLVARGLFSECESGSSGNSMLRAGYGGWLVYTAAAAGDLGFVQELLERDPLIVFGEGEYGVSDVLYGAARSRNSEVFRMILEQALSSGGCHRGEGMFRWEITNRAAHAAARGGNLEMVREIVSNGGVDVLKYRDSEGCTLIHSAAGKGQVEVVKDLITSFDIVNTVDNHGNTGLHVAAYRGCLNVAEVLILASISLLTKTNRYGDTFLHLAVAGFRTPGFQPVDRQIELMRQLVGRKIANLEDVINIRNNDGRTALHLAVSENVQTTVVEMLMTVPFINLNLRDNNGMTPLDLLRQRPKSASSEILIKQLISAGGISNFQDQKLRSVLASHLKVHGLSGSPGTSFRIPDGEILLYSGVDDSNEANFNSCGIEYSGCFSDLGSTKSNSSRPLKNLFLWTRKKEDKSPKVASQGEDTFKSAELGRSIDSSPISLRQRYTKQSSLPTNKRIFASDGFPSPQTRKKYMAGLMHGVIQASPEVMSARSYPSSYSGSVVSSPASVNGRMEAVGSSDKGIKRINRKQMSLHRRLMNQYFCFGSQRLAIEDMVGPAPERL
ncbi:hypothetical protein MLD38_008466 [Melastoma candidum]|uniref:Uncharacterized protein n=1 Tax=Melastoma candidum TaxID=119954 RepID=A0ACB9RUD4_9MYRT|nr:hypothetical protein MLD38_008466 [Melastoma candidum]